MARLRAGLECLGEFFEILSLTLQNDREGDAPRNDREGVAPQNDRGVARLLAMGLYIIRARATLITRVFMRAYINCTRVSALVSRARARIFARVRALCLRIMRAHAKKI